MKDLAAELRIPKTTAYVWAKDVKQAAADCLRARGWGEGHLIDRWIAQAKRSKGHVQNAALREIGEILDVYPARKDPPPAQGPVNVIFATDITQYKEHRYAAHEVGFARSLPQQSQGNAGIGPSESPSVGSRILDAEEGGGKTEA